MALLEQEMRFGSSMGIRSRLHSLSHPIHSHLQASLDEELELFTCSRDGCFASLRVWLRQPQP